MLVLFNLQASEGYIVSITALQNKVFLWPDTFCLKASTQEALATAGAVQNGLRQDDSLVQNILHAMEVSILAINSHGHKWCRQTKNFTVTGCSR